MTRNELLDSLKNADLIALGMLADQAREQRHPEGIVTYCAASYCSTSGATSSACAPILLPASASPDSLIRTLDEFEQTTHPSAVEPILSMGATGTEYLTQVAICRLYFADTSNVEVSPGTVGMKLAQLALRFGANDLGAIESNQDEERLRVLIRDAGFIPKRRDAAYSTLYLQ